MYPCTAATTEVYLIILFFSPAFKSLSFIRSELIALEASVVLSGRAVIRGKCLFGEGGHRELVQLFIRDEYLTGDDSIAFDRSFT